jgi:hypothetical protein
LPDADGGNGDNADGDPKFLHGRYRSLGKVAGGKVANLCPD